jgi:hypothetical protein
MQPFEKETLRQMLDNLKQAGSNCGFMSENELNPSNFTFSLEKDSASEASETADCAC